jgi:hypothetical protein
MPDIAGFAAALTVRASALRAAVQAGYANGKDSSKRFDQSLSGGGADMATSLFLGPLDIDCEGSTNLLVVTLPMWGTVNTTFNNVAHVVAMNGVMQLTLTPVLKKGIAGTDSESSILLDPQNTVVNARHWSATVTSADTPPDVAALITGDAFRSGFEHTFRQGVFFGQIALPSIDGSFLGALVAKSASIMGRVRDNVLLIGINYADDRHSLVGDPESLQDFAGSNDVAGIVVPDAVFVMVDKVHSKLVDGVTAAGATLDDNFDVRPRNGCFRVSGTVSKSGGAVNFSFNLVPSMFHVRPGAYFHYLKKPRWAKSRTWAALEFSISDVQTDVDRSWWTILFGEVIGGILTLGLSDIYIEGLLSAAASEFAGKIESSKLGGPTPRIQRTIPPPGGGIAIRIALDQFEVTETGVFIGVSVRAKPTPAKLLGPTVLPETYRGDVLRYIMVPPAGVTASDPALRIRWTLEDRTHNTVLADADGPVSGRMQFEFTPAAASAAADFGVVARLYRQLGPAVTDLATQSVNLHMRPALAPGGYTRWRWQGSNPQVGVSATTNDWVYAGETRVDRYSEWHRTDAPCRSVNAPARYRYDQQNADRLPFSLKLLENHRKGLCPYCFYGGPAGVNPQL